MDIREHTKKWKRTWTADLSTEDRLYEISKRLLDILLSILMLIILFPLLIIISLLIILDTPGPVIYSRNRVSSRKRQIFRTPHPALSPNTR